MKDKGNDIIMYDSGEDAKFVTNIEGWVDRKGNFFGDDEDAARYYGCTHKPCKQCGKPTIKHRLFCDDCISIMSEKKYRKMPTRDWDESTPAYSKNHDEYFNSMDEVEEYAKYYETSPDAMQLVICDPIYLIRLDEDYFSDELPEETELSDEVLNAIDALNSATKNMGPVSYAPGKYAVKI